MIGGSSGLVNIQKTTELREETGLEVSSLVSVNRLRNSIPADLLVHESLSHCYCLLIWKTDSLRPATVMTSMYLFPWLVLGNGPTMSNATLSIGTPTSLGTRGALAEVGDLA